MKSSLCHGQRKTNKDNYKKKTNYDGAASLDDS